MIYTLAIDTTTRFCSVALARNEAIFVQNSLDDARAHVRELAPMVQALLQEAHLHTADVTRVVVCTGPGSFTGLRVGLSFAKTFAYALDVPCVGVTLFDALTCQIKKPRYILAVDTKCGDFYGAVHHEGNVPTCGLLTLEDVMTYQAKGFEIFSDQPLGDVSPLPDVPLGLIKMMSVAQKNPVAYYMRAPHVSS